MSESVPADVPAGAPTPEAAPADAERRLHPMSWLFVLLQQLKQFIVPLLALVVFGQGDADDSGYGYDSNLWPLIGVGVLAVVSVWQYFTYRYGVSGDTLVVRSGLFERSLRVIPFARIHNVALQQSLLHRMVGVAEVRLESAGGKKPEAEMRVLKLEDALALEALVRNRGTAAPAATVAEPAAAPLLSLNTGEVLRHGLVSNRGLILLAAAYGGMWQVPGLGDIPILGALFRSARWRRHETELVVLVTPRLSTGPESLLAAPDPLRVANEPKAIDLIATGSNLDQPIASPLGGLRGPMEISKAPAAARSPAGS